MRALSSTLCPTSSTYLHGLMSPHCCLMREHVPPPSHRAHAREFLGDTFISGDAEAVTRPPCLPTYVQSEPPARGAGGATDARKMAGSPCNAPPASSLPPSNSMRGAGYLSDKSAGNGTAQQSQRLKAAGGGRSNINKNWRETVSSDRVRGGSTDRIGKRARGREGIRDRM